jgi:hypothetical protein
MNSNNKDAPKGMTRKLKDDGTPNPKYVDLLDEDPIIAGQKYVCISFADPSDIIKQKEMFFFDEFIKYWDFAKSVDKFAQFLNFVSYKYDLDQASLSKDLEEFVKEEKSNLLLTTIEDEYKTFLENHEERLENEFMEQHEFRTCTRGLKIRGSFETDKEAETRAKFLRELDPNHNILVGKVGVWMPWNPDAYKTGRVEYMEEELNELMAKKRQNDEITKIEFEKRVREAKENAIKENIKKAKETGNVLTQTINKDGNLVSVNHADEELTSADIAKELFNNENAIVGDKAKNNDHGLQELLERQTARNIQEAYPSRENTQVTQDKQNNTDSNNNDSDS